jgi:hypothetical protein
VVGVVEWRVEEFAVGDGVGVGDEVGGQKKIWRETRPW